MKKKKQLLILRRNGYHLHCGKPMILRAVVGMDCIHVIDRDFYFQCSVCGFVSQYSDDEVNK